MFYVRPGSWRRKVERFLASNTSNINNNDRPTEAMKDFFQQVFATEVSSPMRKHLAGKGFEVLDIDKWRKAGLLNLDEVLTPQMIISGRGVRPD